MNKTLLIIFLGFGFASCQFFENEDNSGVIARVKNYSLKLSEVEEIIDPSLGQEDSLLIANNYIQKWIKDHLILYKAELNLKEDQKDFSAQLEDYRKTLVTYTYEKELINQRLDTNVSDDEIETFYENNKRNFDLKNNIVKVRYLKVLKSAPRIKKIRKIYFSEKQKDVEKLKDYALQFADKYYLNEADWIEFDEVLKEVPIQVNDKQGYLKNINHAEIDDSLAYYFVYFKEYKLEKDVAPLSFKKQSIKNIIINQRKLGLLSELKNDLYKEALENKEFEIYDVSENKE